MFYIFQTFGLEHNKNFEIPIFSEPERNCIIINIIVSQVEVLFLKQ